MEKNLTLLTRAMSAIEKQTEQWSSDNYCLLINIIRVTLDNLAGSHDIENSGIEIVVDDENLGRAIEINFGEDYDDDDIIYVETELDGDYDKTAIDNLSEETLTKIAEYLVSQLEFYVERD